MVVPSVALWVKNVIPSRTAAPMFTGPRPQSKSDASIPAKNWHGGITSRLVFGVIPE
jgi:hypothetical protein